MSDRRLLGVIIAGSDKAFTERIKQLIEEEVEIDFLGAPEDQESTLNLIEEKFPDVVILDINRGAEGSDNIMKLLITIRFRFPDLVIMVLSNSVHFRLNSLAYGADYFFDKSYDFFRIPETIKSIQLRVCE